VEASLRDAQGLAVRQATTFGHDLLPWSVSHAAHTVCRRCGRAVSVRTWDSGEVQVTGPVVEEVCAPAPQAKPPGGETWT
jgi:hypothetical protein